MRFANPTRLNSLRLQILLAYVAGSLFSIALLVVAAVAAQQSNLLIQFDMSDAAEGMAEKIRFDNEGKPTGFDSDAYDVSWFFDSPQREAAYRFLDSAGNVTALSGAGASFWPADRNQLPLSRGPFEFHQGGITIYGSTMPVEHAGKTWYLQFAASARFMNIIHEHIALPLMGFGITVFSIVLLIVFGVCGYVTLRYTLRPLQEMSASAAAISPSSMHARLKTEAVPSEIAPLVDSFNHVLGRLEQGYRVQQEFLATAAHELKTPLALIRAQIELLEEGAERKSLLNDISHMTRQVQQLLHLAEASEVQGYQFNVINVHDVATEAAEFLKRKADGARVKLVLLDNPAPVQWLADRGALFTLFKNLLENAIEHALPGTDVLLVVSPASISVRDKGPGVDAALIPMLFTRFWRGAHRRDHGAGLGLAICQEIALAHGWVLTAERAEPGLRFRLTNAGVPGLSL